MAWPVGGLGWRGPWLAGASAAGGGSGRSGGAWPRVGPQSKDVYDFSLLEKGSEVWNSGGMVNWPLAYDALHGTMLGGQPRDELNPPRAIGE